VGESLGSNEDQALQDLLVVVMSLSVFCKKTFVGKIDR
jgi:hypothetical protein